MDLKQALKWMNDFFEDILENKDYLSELDNPIGDGDHGINMARGVEAIKETLATKTPESLNELFKTVAMTLLSKVGGASGPLYGSVFLAFAKTTLDKEVLSKNEVTTFFEEGLIALQNRGKAMVGEKTMVDVWAPFVDQLKNEIPSIESINELVEATKPLKATKGRAAYLGDRSIGHIDPGSMSSGYLFKTYLKSVS
jgi:dihydroxyacetone kinase-like protein